MTWLHRDIKVSHDGGEFTITRFPSKGFFAMVRTTILAAWLVAWGVAEYDIGRRLILGLPYKSLSNVRLDPFTWIWFIAWSLGGLAAAAGLYAGVVAGREVVIVKKDEIVASSQGRPWTRTNRWIVGKIGAMRRRSLGTLQRSHSIQFAYEGKTLELLSPSDRESTQRVLDEIRNHFRSCKQEDIFSDGPAED